MNYGLFNPAIAAVFGPTSASVYWSSTTFAFFPFSSAWVVNFNDGVVSFVGKSNVIFGFVRAVRGGS